MKKIAIIIIVIITFGIGWKFYKKYKGTEKLKIGTTSLKPVKKIQGIPDLIDIFQNGIIINGFVEVKNLSNIDYTLNQINLDCLSPKTEKVIAEQINIIQKDIIIKKKGSTKIPLTYRIDVINALSLFKENGAIPEDTTLFAVITNPLNYHNSIDLSKLQMKFKGFIKAEGITINIDENYSLYE